jgi:hypothetical protein
LRRVVKPGGKLFVQANFSGRMPDVWWFRVMPEWRNAGTAQFRPEAEVKGDFARIEAAVSHGYSRLAV